jgi:hypothetical protein
MTTAQSQNGSATIYQFPARGRFAERASHHGSEPARADTARATRVVLDSGWYHDEAIEAERARSN